MRSVRAWEGNAEEKEEREVMFMQGREMEGMEKLQEEGREMEKKGERDWEREDQQDEEEEEGGRKRLEVRRYWDSTRWRIWRENEQRLEGGDGEEEAAEM